MISNQIDSWAQQGLVGVWQCQTPTDGQTSTEICCTTIQIGMKYNSNKHHRRSLRLKGYDYSSSGMYFITICTYQRECLFGEIVNGEMQCSEFGAIVQDCWQQIPDHFPKVQLDASVVMPNHIHGILWIQDDGDVSINRRGMALPCPYKREFGKPIAGSLSTVMGSFKSVTTRRINILRDALKISIWQRNYYEHIIRNEEALQHIRQYVQNNAIAWQHDQLHPDNPSKW